MNKNKLSITIGVLIVAVIISFLIFRSSQQISKSSGKINTSGNSSLKSITSSSFLEYNDPVGFSFNFPNSVVVSPKKTTDDNVYSSLNVTSSSTSGKITIEAVSSDLLTLKSLISTKTNVTDIKLADLDAKQYTEKGNVITLALDKGVLFTITSSSGENVNFWKEINNKIISSFVFALPETTQVDSDATSQSDSTDSTESDVSFEGEETIE